MVERNDTVTPGIVNNDLSNTTCPVGNTSMDIVVDLTLNKSKSAHSRVVYDWSETQIGNLQAAYFYGYMATMLIGAKVLLQYYGVFLSLQMILVLNGVGTVLFPLITIHFGYVGALISRFLLGAVQGPTTSILASSLFDWSLPSVTGVANILEILKPLVNIRLSFSISFDLVKMPTPLSKAS